MSLCTQSYHIRPSSECACVYVHVYVWVSLIYHQGEGLCWHSLSNPFCLHFLVGCLSESRFHRVRQVLAL